MTRFLEVLWSIILETAPYVLIGMVAAGLIAESLGAHQRLRRFATRKNFLSLTAFNLMGFVTPICSCGTVPIAVGMRKQGVPFGSVYAFIFTAPATSIAAVIFAVGMLGRQFALAYVAGAVVCGYLIGGLFHTIDRFSHRGLPEFGLASPPSLEPTRPIGGFWARALHRGLLVYGSEIAFDLIVGLILVSLLISVYSIGDLTAWFNGLPYLAGAGLMILLALPLYVCSLPGILMGATMCLSGLQPELVWVFLMSGPITNLADMNVLRRRIGLQTTTIYMVTVVCVTVLWGLVVKSMVDPTATWLHVQEYFQEYPAVIASTLHVDVAPANNGGLTLWRVGQFVTALIYVGLMVRGAWIELRRSWLNPCEHCKHYQQHHDLSLALCREPCLKRNVLVRLRALAWRVLPRAGLATRR